MCVGGWKLVEGQRGWTGEAGEAEGKGEGDTEEVEVIVSGLCRRVGGLRVSHWRVMAAGVAGAEGRCRALPPCKPVGDYVCIMCACTT